MSAKTPRLVLDAFAGPGGWLTDVSRWEQGLRLLGINPVDLTGRTAAQRVAQRFAAKIDPRDGCLVWTKASTERGYGRVRIAKREFGAHRVALVVWTGLALDRDELACHHCDNPPCVDPEHLFHGDAAANTRDMDIKGRRRNGPCRGELNGQVKLTLLQVQWLRQNPQIRAEDAAASLSVSASLVRQIRRGDAWRWAS